MKKGFIALGICIAILSTPLNVSALDSSCHGYGQGYEVNSENVPICAENFNNMYSQYGAYALTNAKNSILLTFDQGYENGYTSKILDTLKEKNVHALFFLTGDYAKKETSLVRRMIDEGHAIGNHGMKHLSMPKLSETELKEEISSLHDYVYQQYGYEMQYLRPPCGEFSEQSLKLASDLGYSTIMWSFAYVDWKTDSQPDAKEALDKMVSSAHGGAIYLLHSVSATNAQVLGDMIDTLKSQGYCFE